MRWRPPYLLVFLTFLRNSLIRDMTFRTNFIIETISSMTWVLMTLAFYIILFQHTDEIGPGTGWGKYEFFVFVATTLFVSSIIEVFVMSNLDEFSELIRTGNLDFALVKPIDTQFLVSLRRVDWSSAGDFVIALVLLVYALLKLQHVPSFVEIVLYFFYVGCGVCIMYSLIVSLAACSVWFGRNQSIYEFWFYIANFARYPMEIYRGPLGKPLRLFFTFVLPVLLVSNVPARVLLRAILPQQPWDWILAVYALFAAAASFAIGRLVFTIALESYRSASS